MSDLYKQSLNPVAHLGSLKADGDWSGAPRKPECPMSELRLHKFKSPFSIYHNGTEIGDEDGHVCSAENPDIALALVVALNENATLRKQLVKLREALAWIDNHDPEIVAAAESKFGFSLIDDSGQS